MSETSAEANRIERDLEDTRSRLDATIGALQQKLSPGDMVDQAMTYFKETGGGEMGRNMLVNARENPIPLALVGVGLAWLMFSDPEAKRLERERRERQAELDQERHARALASYRETRPTSAPAKSYERPATGSDLTSGGYTSAEAAGSPYGSTAYGGSPSYGAGERLHGATDAEEAKPGYLTQAGAYASSAMDDLSTKASEAGASLQQGAEEASDAFQDRVAATRGAVLGLKRDAEETASAFGDRVSAAMSEAADRYRSWRASAAEAGQGLLARGQSAAQGAQSMAQNAYGTAASAASGAYGSASSAASGAYNTAASAVGSAYEQGSAAAQNLYEQGSAAADSVREGVSSMASGARQTATRGVAYLQDQPLLMGALGLSLGAVLASLIPPTRYEDEHVGPHRDRLLDQAQDYAADAADSALKVGQTVIGKAKESAERQGLTNVDVHGTAADARSQVRDAAGRVRSVVEETLAAGKDAAKEEFAAKTGTQPDEQESDAAKPGPA